MDDPFPEGMLADIERFFESEDGRPPGLPIYPDVFATGTMFPLQRQRELIEMMRTARAIEPRTVYEIGADKGGGLYHWCKCLPSVTRVIACEIRGTPYCSLFERHFPDIEFLWLPQSSYRADTVLKVSQWLKGTQIDCLFIDGNKSAFLDDFFAYRPLMNDRGIVFLHDVTDSPGPKDAFDFLISRGYPHRLIHDTRDAEEAVLRAKRMVSTRSAHENWLRHWKGASCGVGVIYLEGGPT